MRLSAGDELALFYTLGILDELDDDYFGDVFGVLITMLIGAFDIVVVYSIKFILIMHDTLHAGVAVAGRCAAAAAVAAQAVTARAGRRRCAAEHARAL